jgi:tRNA A-37 threonylcarbamoyl transferase component Bud32
MKGWLTVRTGPLLLTSERCFFRLQWGFLSQYASERAAAISRYCIHAATISASEEARKIVLAVGPLGVLTAHGTDAPLGGGPTPAPPGKRAGPAALWRRERNRRAVAAADGAAEAAEAAEAAADGKPRRLVLVAGTVEEFRLWLLLLSRGRSRSIGRRFQVEESVGSGAAGDVFRAACVGQPGLQVAVKRIEYHSVRRSNAARNLRRIQKEIQTQVKAATRSPYVVSIMDVFFDSRHVYLVMELVKGGSLREWLDERGPVEERVAVSVAQQLARCLLVLHQNRIVHRDVKADNVLLELDGDGNMAGVRLADFGFAEVCRGGSMDSFCSTFLGTASYMATEIAWFDSYGAPVDVYALGVLCYVMLTGEYPFDDPAGLIATLDRIKAADAEGVRTSEKLSPDARSFCLALTNPHARKRLTAAAALQHRWVRRGRDVTAGAMRAPHVKRTGRAWFRRIFHMVAVALALQRWAAAPRPQRRPVEPTVAAARRRMLQRLDREAHSRQAVPRQTLDGAEDDGEVFVGEESSRVLGALRRT